MQKYFPIRSAVFIQPSYYFLIKKTVCEVCCTCEISLIYHQVWKELASTQPIHPMPTHRRGTWSIRRTMQILWKGENFTFHISLNLWEFHSIFIQTNIATSSLFIRLSSKKCGIVNLIICNLHSTSTSSNIYFCSFNSLNTFKFVRSFAVRSSEFLARLQPVFKAANKQLVARSLLVKTYRNFKRIRLCATKTNYIVAKFTR